MAAKRKRKGKLVKILGREVREGTKKHARLLADKRHYDDLARYERNGPMLQINSARGRKVRKNARVTLPVKSLRRLISAAKRGEKTTVKAFVK